jgi:nucleotidyltransferase/DNA polymerase involved in DNA repair
MNLRQAQSTCPELVLHPVDLHECQTVQDTLLNTLTTWGLPLEEIGWGHAYLDLHLLATTRQKVQPLAIELGRQIRAALGTELQPSIGWDSGKFTAHAAANIALPGKIRLVSREEEVPFLSPLSINLLPLSPEVKHELTLLGIHTLGKFAQLPTTAVVRRFGPAARMAHQWSQGHDPRPVHNSVRATFSPITTDIDPPTGLVNPIIEALLTLLRPWLDAFALELAGCRKLNIDMKFLDGSKRTLNLTFATAITKDSTLCASLAHHLQNLNWPAEMEKITVSGLEKSELPAAQLSLFPEFVETVTPGNSLVQRLKQVYGPIFYRGKVVAPLHLMGNQCSTVEEWI